MVNDKNNKLPKYYFYCTAYGKLSWVHGGLIAAGVPNQLGYFCPKCRLQLLKNTQ